MNQLINLSWLYDKIQETYALTSYHFGKGKALLPLRYTLELTYRCNLNCHYCYVGQNKQTNELSTEEWIRIIDQIPPFRLITLVGGETLLRKDFKTLLNRCLDRGKVNIVTNATLFNDELIKTFVDRKLLLLNVSIDGIGEKHDINRGHKGAFDKVVKNLERLNQVKGNKKYPILDIKTVILKDNLEDLVDIYKLAVDFKADFFTPSFLKESDLQQNSILRENFGEEFYRNEYPINPYFDMDHFKDVYRRIQELAKKNKTRIRFYPKFDTKAELAQIERYYTDGLELKVQDIYERCLYPWSNILITPEGNVYPCLSLNVGNVKDVPVERVWNSDKFVEYRKMLKKYGMFNSCQACCQLKVKC